MFKLNTSIQVVDAQYQHGSVNNVLTIDKYTGCRCAISTWFRKIQVVDAQYQHGSVINVLTIYKYTCCRCAISTWFRK